MTGVQTCALPICFPVTIAHPVLDENNEVQYIIHRVEEVTDFVQLAEESEKTAQQNNLLESQIERMKIEIIKRSKELEKLNAQLDKKVIHQVQRRQFCHHRPK